MMRLAVLLMFLSLTLSAAVRTLDIYWIDVEGGAATLIVTPAGETVLMDAGWPGFDGRDARRIERVLSGEADAEKIDYFITSHFHSDHVGGLPQLAERVPIGQFVDHGESVDLNRQGGQALWESYLSVARGKRLEALPGAKLPLSGADLIFVASHSRFLTEPLPGGRENPYCGGARLLGPDTGENGKSVGFVLRFGDFEFLNLGDLTWNYEHELACPVNRVGEVDLYQVTHHGLHTSAPPQQVWAARPAVAVMNNGPRKGGRPEVYEVLEKSPGLEDIWQVHLSLETDEAHNTDKKMIANLEETASCKGHWIKASVQENGSYTVTNSRNGFSKTYSSR